MSSGAIRFSRLEPDVAMATVGERLGNALEQDPPAVANTLIEAARDHHLDDQVTQRHSVLVTITPPGTRSKGEMSASLSSMISPLRYIRRAGSVNRSFLVSLFGHY